jgi:galactose-1-phosphate uridylyltransferase
VWEDHTWRLSVVLQGAIAGFSHLEPKRHIPFVTDLDGEEAATLGAVLARVTRAMAEATGADKIYVYVFGDRVAHLHHISYGAPLPAHIYLDRVFVCPIDLLRRPARFRMRPWERSS